MPSSQRESQMTIYQALQNLGILEKAVNVSLKKARVPHHLRDDARQQILTEWCRRIARTDLKSSQIAHYATLVGAHAALSVRRELENPVRIPSGAFNREAPGPRGGGVRPGHLADPVSFETYGEAINEEWGQGGVDWGDASRFDDPLEVLISDESDGRLQLELRAAYALDNGIGCKNFRTLCEAILDGRGLSSVSQETGVSMRTMYRHLLSLGRLTQDMPDDYKPTRRVKKRIRDVWKVSR